MEKFSQKQLESLSCALMLYALEDMKLMFVVSTEVYHLYNTLHKTICICFRSANKGFVLVCFSGRKLQERTSRFRPTRSGSTIQIEGRGKRRKKPYRIIFPCPVPKAVNIAPNSVLGSMGFHIYIIHCNDDNSAKVTNEIIYIPGGGGGGVRLPLPHLYNPDCFLSFGDCGRGEVFL